MLGRREAGATCTVEQADSRTGTRKRADWDREPGSAQDQSENRSYGVCANHTEMELQSARGRLAVLETQRTETRQTWK